MIFSSLIYLFFFFLIVLLAYYLVPRKLKNLCLVIFSLAFYAWGEPVYVVLMILTILVDFCCGLLIGRFSERRGAARAIVLGNVLINLGLLAWFKYAGMLVSTFDQITGLGVSIPEVALPIGISFYTFESISYSVDVYRKEAPPMKNIINFATYLSFFPHLVAGPIVRYEKLQAQVVQRQETLEKFTAGMMRFCQGVFKKVLLANNLAGLAERVQYMGNPSTPEAWMGILAYTFQIYFDFSGYSDMAIGLGRMFGFHFLENFDRPYISRSVTEFWRRWHISMGSWFRDYLYIPLGGNRVSRGRHLFNMFVVWLATGIWHGANWTFLVWGLFYFVILAVEKETGLAKKLGAGKGPKPGRAASAAGHLYTMLFVLLGWVIFRADSLGQAWQYFAAMFGANGVSVGAKAWFYLREYAPELIAGVLVSGTLLQRLGQKKGMQTVYAAALVLLFLASVAYVVKGSYSPFIYLNF